MIDDDTPAVDLPEPDMPAADLMPDPAAPQPAPQPRAFFLDGHCAAVHPAFLSLDEDHDGAKILRIKTAPVEGAAPAPETADGLASDRADPQAPRLWRMEDLRLIPGQAGGDKLVVTHKDHPLARLIVEGPEAHAAILRDAVNLKRRPPVRGKGRLAAWALAATASVALIIFGFVPLLANQLAPYLPPAGEKALGDTTYEQIRKALSNNDLIPVDTCESDDGLAALALMQSALEAHANLPYELTVTVLDHDMVNAFALPGGRIVMFRGLIDRASNPNEIAAVFAHEMGHVENRDPTRHALRAAGSFGVLGLLFGDFAGGTAVLLVANRLIEASYSQSAESGADDYAYDVLTGARVSPANIGTFFEKLRADMGDEGGLVAHFATHPKMVDRIEAAQAAADARGAPDDWIITRDEWASLQRICAAD